MRCRCNRAQSDSYSHTQHSDVPSSIPTTAAIAEAREKRERMRLDGGGTGSDAFISLEVGLAVKSGQSRLVREDDEIGDGDEGKPIFCPRGRAEP